MKVGVALKPGTPMEAVAPFVGLVDMVLVAAFQPSLRPLTSALTPIPTRTLTPTLTRCSS